MLSSPDCSRIDELHRRQWHPLIISTHDKYTVCGNYNSGIGLELSGKEVLVQIAMRYGRVTGRPITSFATAHIFCII